LTHRPTNCPISTCRGPPTDQLLRCWRLRWPPENHIRFFRLMKKISLVFLRNGAFSARLDQDMDNPNRFRLQAMYSSWALVERLDRRNTRDEHALWSELWY